jgi:3-oxosteroid 1-dehydrogenase
MINNLPAQWDMEADVVAIGSGIGGLSAAITACENGASAIVLERADVVGGVTALSLGEVWVPGNHLEPALGIEDSAESGYRYLKRLAMDYGNEALILNLAVHAREALQYFTDRIGLDMCVIRNCPDYYYGASNDGVAEGRMLEVNPFPAETLGDWQERTRISPFVPYQLTHHDMYAPGGPAHIDKWDYGLMAERMGKDERCLGPGLAACFVKGALDKGVRMETSVNVEELIGDGSRIAGVRATRDGRDIFVKANKGVVIAASSYERNRDMTKALSQQIDIDSMIFPTVDGANFRLAGSVGGKIAKVPDITLTGVRVPGEELEDGSPMTRSVMQPVGLPHTIVVNRIGKRFGNESFYREFYYKIDAIDGSNQTHPNFPCWAVFDSQAREKYPFASIMPGQDFPDGMVHKADTLEELARLAGIDADGLAQAIARFNPHAEKGEDPDWGRGTHHWSTWMAGDPHHKPNPNLGPLLKPPFYAAELVRMGGSAIPASGLVTDHHSRVINWHDKPIEGLYAAGNSVARLETGAVMQSGVSNARGMTHGWLAARHACGDPSNLLEGEIRRLGL